MFGYGDLSGELGFLKEMKATGQDSVKAVEKLGVEKPEKGKMSSKKKNVKKDGDESESGFWFRFKLMFSCISSRSKVDSSMNATTVIGKISFFLSTDDKKRLFVSVDDKVSPDLVAFTDCG